MNACPPVGSDLLASQVSTPTPLSAQTNAGAANRAANGVIVSLRMV